MEFTTIDSRKCKRNREGGACQQDEGIAESWKKFQQKWEIDLEGTARASKALQRKREIRSAEDLLRLIVWYAMNDWSLRLTALWAALTNIGYLSDVAVLKRLRNSVEWLGKLIGMLLQRRLSDLQSLPGVRMRVVDATTISIPGSSGTGWRIHLSFDLGNFCLDGVEISDKYGGESLARFEARDNEIWIADAGYAFASGMAPVLDKGAKLIVRINWRNVPVIAPDGQRLKVIDWLRTVTDLSERSVWMKMPSGWFAFRLIAAPLPPEKAESARRRVRLAYQRKKKPLNPDTLFAAGFVLLLTNLPVEDWSARKVLALYRMRWQIEVYIKRLKSVLNFDLLRAKDARLAQTYLLAKILIALITDQFIAYPVNQFPDWFACLDRPVSPQRLTMLFRETLRQIMTRFNVSSLQISFPRLRRYLCDPPRRRLQHSAWGRALALHSSFHDFCP
ncbi:transposase [Bellilinea sp.]